MIDRPNHNRAHDPDESGFTLIEVLVAAAITSILAIGLTSMINQIISVSEKYERLSTIRSNLTFGLNRMVEDLRRIARQNDTWNNSDFEYRFLGVDGDGAFNNDDMTDERLSDNNQADRMYFHVLFPDKDMGGSDPTRSGRGSIGYFLSPKENKVYQSGTWRLIRFNQKQDEKNTENGVLVPPLNPDIDSLYSSEGSKNDIAVQIDRLSLRYMDADGNWQNSWDSQARGGELPYAVEIAVRGYDPSSDSPNSVEPQWRTTIVSLRPRE